MQIGKQRRVIGLVAMAMCLYAIFLGGDVSAADPGESLVRPVGPPLAMPKLSLRDSADNPVPEPEPARHGLVVMHIWASWCAPCRGELPELDRLMGALSKELRDRIGFVTIAADRHPGPVDRLLRELSIRHIAAHRDPDFRVLRVLGVRQMPTTCFLVPMVTRSVASKARCAGTIRP